MDKEKTDKIISCKGDVYKYLYFLDSKDIGIVYSPKDLSFTEMMLFNWIKDGLGGRKT